MNFNKPAGGFNVSGGGMKSTPFHNNLVSGQQKAQPGAFQMGAAKNAFNPGALQGGQQQQQQGGAANVFNVGGQQQQQQAQQHTSAFAVPGNTGFQTSSAFANGGASPAKPNSAFVFANKMGSPAGQQQGGFSAFTNQAKPAGQQQGGFSAFTNQAKPPVTTSAFAPQNLQMSSQASGFRQGGMSSFGVQNQQQQITGFEGELRQFANIKKSYAPIQLPNMEGPHSYMDVNESLNSRILEVDDRYNKHPAETLKAYGFHDFPWNPDCDFKFDLFPLKESVDPSLRYQQDNIEAAAEMGEANPDPKRLVPVKRYGIKELYNRFVAQNKDAENMDTHMVKMRESTYEQKKQEQAQLQNKFNRFQEKHMRQKVRMTKIIRDVEILRNRNLPLTNDEIRHREEYDRLMVKKSEYENKLESLSQLNDKYVVEVEKSENDVKEYYEDITDEDLLKIYDLLKRQSEGIAHLYDIVGKDLRDMRKVVQDQYRN